MSDDAHTAVRLELIREIDRREGTNLICYIGGIEDHIERDDLLNFVELVDHVPEDEPVDLLLHSCGGDVDACEKIVSYIHAQVDHSKFRVVVPDMAKSAGMLLALGGSKILMGDTSELGMIDPQFLMRDAHGAEFTISVMAYLSAYEMHVELLRQNPNDQVALLTLDNFDPRLVKKFQCMRDRVRIFAEDMLKRSGAPASSISEKLLEIGRWHTHGQPIGYASAKQFEMPVEYVPEERWKPYWNLYRQQRRELRGRGKLFESAHFSELVRPL